MLNSSKKNILFLLSHQPNPRFVKQIKYLSKNNYIYVIYFERDSLKTLENEYLDVVELNLSLGSIENEKIISRIVDYFKSIAMLRKVLSKISIDNVILNNIDILLLYKVVNIGTPKVQKTNVVMEISDLRSHAYIKSSKSFLIRKLERYLFKSVDSLIVTSIKFYELYYNSLIKNKPFVLENKPLSEMIPEKIAIQKENNKLIIGIVGLLLQGNPYKTLLELVKNREDIEVHVYGKGYFTELIKEYSSKYQNIKYFGEYNFFRDSANIYASLDMIYMPYDTNNGSLNNKIALPNKLYEAMYFHTPIITSGGTYTGELVEMYNIGVTVKCCDLEELKYTIQTFSSKKDDIKKSFFKLDSDVFLADNDYMELEKFLKG